MKADSKLWLDTNRHHLVSITQGHLSGINIPTLERIMREEFRPDYPLFAHEVFDHVAEFVKALYVCYDQWLIDNPDWSPNVTRYGMREESISFLDAHEAAAKEMIHSGSARGFDIDGLLKVMLLEFNPAYQLNYDDPDQPGKMVRDVYSQYNGRKATSIPPAADLSVNASQAPRKGQG